VDLGHEVPAHAGERELLAGAGVDVTHVHADAAQLLDEQRLLAVAAVEQAQHPSVERLAHRGPAERVPKLALALLADLACAEPARYAAELLRPPAIDGLDSLRLGCG